MKRSQDFRTRFIKNLRKMRKNLKRKIDGTWKMKHIKCNIPTTNLKNPQFICREWLCRTGPLARLSLFSIMFWIRVMYVGLEFYICYETQFMQDLTKQVCMSRHTFLNKGTISFRPLGHHSWFGPALQRVHYFFVGGTTL